MQSESKFTMTLVTAPDLDSARKLTDAILEARAAACVNIVNSVESCYWWEGKIERDSECLLIIKSTEKKLTALEQLVVDNHPYDTPEFITFPIESGHEKYLSWLAECTR